MCAVLLCVCLVDHDPLGYEYRLAIPHDWLSFLCAVNHNTTDMMPQSYKCSFMGLVKLHSCNFYPSMFVRIALFESISKWPSFIWKYLVRLWADECQWPLWCATPHQCWRKRWVFNCQLHQLSAGCHCRPLYGLSLDSLALTFVHKSFFLCCP